MARERQTVLLLHTLPDGSWHFDWLIDAGGEGLLTYRLAVRVDTPPPAAFRADRLPDHRRAYLGYQGPVSGGRGRVERVAAGICAILSRTESSLGVRVTWPRGAPGVWRGRCLEKERWMFEPDS